MKGYRAHWVQGSSAGAAKAPHGHAPGPEGRVPGQARLPYLHGVDRSPVFRRSLRPLKRGFGGGFEVGLHMELHGLESLASTHGVDRVGDP